MFTDDFLPLQHLLAWMDRLSPELEDDYKIRATLIPRWKNYLVLQVDRFDRYPEMISHGSIHVCNILSLASELLIPSLKRWEVENRKREVSPPISGEELFLLITGIFLHDIGMADISESSLEDPEDLRKKHSVNTGKILRMQWEQQFKFEQNYVYQVLLSTFPSRDEVDIVAEICIHHQSSAPLAIKDFVKGKSTATALEQKYDVNENLKYFHGEEIDIYLITALLRFIDACDTQYSRAGGIFVTATKMENNRRLIKECKNKIKFSKGRLQVYYEQYVEYLQKQRDEHYPKHSVIQKVWIIRKQVVYKPATQEELRLMAPFLEDAAINPKYFINLFVDEIQKEIAVCNEYLSGRGLDILGIRLFDEKKDAILFSKLAPYNRLRQKLPPLKKEWIKNRAIERCLVSKVMNSIGSQKVLLVVAPKGAGKTCLGKIICKEIAKKKRVCYIPFATLKAFRVSKEEMPDQYLRNIYRQMINFLASWGDFLFYNKVRMEMDIEERQWDILFNHLDENKNVFIFDDLHLLPLQNENLPIFRFFKQFFERLNKGKASVIVFTQKVPHPLISSNYSRYELFDSEAFTADELEYLTEKDHFIGFKGSLCPEGQQRLKKIIEKYSGLPIVLDFIREETNMITEFEPQALDRLEATIKERMRQHILSIRKVLKMEEQNLLDFLIRYPSHAIPDYDLLSKQIGKEKSETETAWKNLIWRNLLHSPKAKGTVWFLDSWWKQKFADLWNERLECLELGLCSMEALIEDIPELKQLQGLYQGTHHDTDAFQHSVETFACLKKIVGEPEKYLEGLPFPKRPDLLLLAAIMHDVGKSKCHKETKKGIQFIMHEEVGSVIARQVGTRLGLHGHEVDYIESVVKFHLRPLMLIHEGHPTFRAITRLNQNLGQYASDVFLLAIADIRASREEDSSIDNDFTCLRQLIFQCVDIKAKMETAASLPTLISGKDLQDLAIPPGPIYSQILREVSEMQRHGELKDRNDALSWLKQRVK